MGWKHYQTVDPLKNEPQVGRELFGIRLLILHFKFQFSKSINISQFLHFNLSQFKKKNLSFPKCPEITHKFTQNHKTLVNILNRWIWRCLKQILAQSPCWATSKQPSCEIPPKLVRLAVYQYFKLLARKWPMMMSSDFTRERDQYRPPCNCFTSPALNY